MDEGRPGKRAAGDAAGAQNKWLKRGLHAYFKYSPPTDSPVGIEQKQDSTDRKQLHVAQKRDRTDRKPGRTDR
ncbi:hypothetical protein N9L68_03745 [bacterium]|nr:hypothetical protein [bacterium]